MIAVKTSKKTNNKNVNSSLKYEYKYSPIIGPDATPRPLDAEQYPRYIFFLWGYFLIIIAKLAIVKLASPIPYSDLINKHIEINNALYINYLRHHTCYRFLLIMINLLFLESQ